MVAIVKSKDAIWNISGLEDKVRELIDNGILHKGVDALLTKANDFLKGKEGAEKAKLRKSHLMRSWDDLVWTSKRRNLLRRFVQLGQPLELVYKDLKMIPKGMIDREAKKLRGISVSKEHREAMIGAGVGRLLTQAEVGQKVPAALTSHRLDRPFEIAIQNSESFGITVINAPHLGMEYNRLIDENVLRNMFREAERNGDDAIFLTGGLIFIDPKKSSGSLTTHRALLSGLDFDPSVLPEAYRKEAALIRKALPPDRVTFANLRERVLNAMGGWKKVVTHKNGSPIFSRKIYISFGVQEEEIIDSAAHAEILYITTVMRNGVMRERLSLEALLRSKLADNDGIPTEETEKLEQDIADLLEKEKRMVQSNVDAEDRKRFVDSVRAAVVRWFMEAIPNSEFLGQGSVVCKVGSKMVEIVQAPAAGPTSATLDGYMKVAGQRSLEGKSPDLALVAAPFNLDARYGVVEKIVGGERFDLHAWQLPVAVDRDYVRGARPEMIRKQSPMERMLRDPGFEPGAFRVGYVGGAWAFQKLPITMFRTHHTSPALSRNISDYLYVIVDSDNHAGLRSKEWVYDAATGLDIPLEVAFARFLNRAFLENGKSLPIHAYANIGDDIQGHHFPTQQTIHAWARTYPQNEKRVREILDEAKKTSDTKDLRVLLGKLGRDFLQQIRYRGEDWPASQLEEFIMTSLRARAPMYAEILKTSQKAKLQLRGIKEVLHGKGEEDSRDIGVLNFVGGDHFSHSTLEELSEGPIYRRALIGFLASEKSLGLDADQLEPLVRAPIWGNMAIGYGLISVPDGYEWGITIRHKPTASTGKNGDRMGGMVSNLLERGDYPRIFTGRHFIQLSGHIHFYGAAFSRNKFLISCASSTDGDAFGDMLGFRRNNSGGMVVGIPAKGPDYGPIRIIPFPLSFLRAYLEKPWKIDWNSIFVDPVGL